MVAPWMNSQVSPAVRTGIPGTKPLGTAHELSARRSASTRGEDVEDTIELICLMAQVVSDMNDAMDEPSLTDVNPWFAHECATLNV